MDLDAFYQQLFAPLAELGPFDPDTPLEPEPFDPMGEIPICRFLQRDGRFCTFVTTGLAVCPEQKPSRLGRYELLISSDDEAWAREVAADIGRMSFDVRFEGGHTFDLTSWAFETDTLQGILFEEAYRVRIDGQPFGVMWCLGITKRELGYARAHGTKSLISDLRRSEVFPHSDRMRRSVVGPGTDFLKAPLPLGTVGSVQSHSVQDLDLNFVRALSGHQAISAVTVMGRDLDELSTESIWFRLDVRLEDEIGLVQVRVPVEGKRLLGVPQLKVAWHEGILFPPTIRFCAVAPRTPHPRRRRLWNTYTAPTWIVRFSRRFHTSLIHVAEGL